MGQQASTARPFLKRYRWEGFVHCLYDALPPQLFGLSRHRISEHCLDQTMNRECGCCGITMYQRVGEKNPDGVIEYKRVNPYLAQSCNQMHNAHGEEFYRDGIRLYKRIATE